MTTETGRYNGVWLLGHYDSRGGCSAYVGMTRFEAVHELAKAFGWSSEEEVEFNYHQLRNAEDDVMGEATVRFVGTPTPKHHEDVLYGRTNVVDLVRRIKEWESGAWEMEVVIIAGEVLGIGEDDEWPEEIEWEGEKWEVDMLGEDAFGLLWFTEKEE